MTAASCGTPSDERTAWLRKADPRDQPGRGRLALVDAVGGEGRQLEERAPGVEQTVDPVADEQLPARDVLLPRRLAAPLPHLRQQRAQVRRQRLVVGPVLPERLRRGVHLRLEDLHAPDPSGTPGARHGSTHEALPEVR
jgi:hypothetical protein